MGLKTLKNTGHLGDCLLTLNLLNKIIKINYDVNFDFSVYPFYVNEIKQHVEDISRIRILPNTYGNSYFDSWFGNSWNLDDKFHEFFDQGVYDPFLYMYYNKICEVFDVESPIKNFEDVLYENVKLKDKNSLCYEHDFFIINSQPYSGQYPDFNFNDFINLAKNLKDKGYSVITINDVGLGIPNTRGMNLLEIGAISTYSKNIIGVATGPAITCTSINNYKRKNLNSFQLLTIDTLNIPFVTTIQNINDIKI